MEDNQLEISNEKMIDKWFQFCFSFDKSGMSDQISSISIISCLQYTVIPRGKNEGTTCPIFTSVAKYPTLIACVETTVARKRNGK